MALISLDGSLCTYMCHPAPAPVGCLLCAVSSDLEPPSLLGSVGLLSHQHGRQPCSLWLEGPKQKPGSKVMVTMVTGGV